MIPGLEMVDEESMGLKEPTRSFTNQVLFYEETTKNNVVFVPAYVRFKIKSIHEVSLESLQAKINGVLLISFYYGDLSEEMVDLFKDKIVLQFGRDDSMLLDEQQLSINFTENHDKKSFQYMIRKVFVTELKSDIFWSPFELVNLILSVTLQNVKIKQKICRGKSCVVKFNCMNSDDKQAKVSYSENCMYEKYQLAENLIEVEYSQSAIAKFEEPKPVEKKVVPQNQQSVLQRQDNTAIQINQKKPKKKPKGIKYYNYSHFKFPLYKHPFVTLIVIFIPLWLLGILNIVIFFQNTDLQDRVANIATVMLSFVALAPTVREQVPASPGIIFLEILVFLEIFTSLLCLIESYQVRGDPDYTVQGSNGYLLVSIIITILEILIIIIMFLVHMMCWQPQYREENYNNDKRLNDIQWKNTPCDDYFRQNFPQILAWDAPVIPSSKHIKLPPIRVDSKVSID